MTLVLQGPVAGRQKEKERELAEPDDLIVDATRKAGDEEARVEGSVRFRTPVDCRILLRGPSQRL